MALDYGFDNSTTYELINGIFPQGDKAKDASFMSALINSFISSGVSPSYEDSFILTAGSGLTVIRNSGEAMFKGKYLRDADTAVFTVTPGADNYHYLRYDFAAGTAAEGIYINPPVGTHPVRAGDIYEMLTAKVTVPAGAAQVTSGMITDLRPDDNWCGFMRLRAGIDIENAGITTEQIFDTADKFIPKRGTERQVVKGSGITTQLTPIDMTGGLHAEDTYGDFVIMNDGRHFTNPLLIPKNVVGAGLTNQANMYNNVFNTTFASIALTSSTPQDFYIVYGIPDIPPDAYNVKIKFRLKAAGYNAGAVTNLTVTAAAYNINKSADISAPVNVPLILYTSAQRITDIELSYAKASDLPSLNLGLRIKVTNSSATSATLYIYGSDMNYEYERDSNETLRFDGRGLYMGRYAFTYDESKQAALLKEYARSFGSTRGIPVSYDVLQGTVTNPENMLSDIGSATYASASYVPNASNAPKVNLKLSNSPVIPANAKDIRVRVEIHFYTNVNTASLMPALYLYNELTGVRNETGVRVTAATAAGGEIRAFQFTYADLSAFGGVDTKLGLQIDGSNTGATSFTLQVYGMNAIVDYEVEESILMRLNDNGSIFMKRWVNMTAGSYSFIENGENVDIIYSNPAALPSVSNLTAQSVTGNVNSVLGNVINNINNAANPLTNNTYASFAVVNGNEYGYDHGYVTFTYGNLPSIPSGAINITITAKVRVSRTSDGSGAGSAPSLQYLTLSYGSVTLAQNYYSDFTGETILSVSYKYNSVADIPSQAFKMIFSFWTNVGGEVRIYGSELSVSYYSSSGVIGRLTPTGIQTPALNAFLGVPW